MNIFFRCISSEQICYKIVCTQYPIQISWLNFDVSCSFMKRTEDDKVSPKEKR